MTRRKSSKPEPQGNSGPGALAGTEVLVLLQVLRDDHAERWTREELRRELVNIDPAGIDESLAAMEAAGVVLLDGDHVEPSRCARWFDSHYVVTI
jgi:DNA-binding HxlR family transcriptional regulator